MMRSLFPLGFDWWMCLALGWKTLQTALMLPSRYDAGQALAFTRSQAQHVMRLALNCTM